jgi:hypothetical protein
MTGYTEKLLHNAVDIARLSLQYVRKYHVLWNIYIYIYIFQKLSLQNKSYI